MSIEIRERKLLKKGKFVSLWGTEFVAGDQIRTWEWIEKFDVAYVLPVTTEGKFVLTRQFRIPINAYVLETPAGIIDAKDSAKIVALKEFLEETGYATDRPLETLPTYPISAALTNGLAYGFFARDVTRVGIQKLEDAEDIEVLELSKNQILDMAFRNDVQNFVDPRLLGLIEMVEKKFLIKS